MAFAHYEKHTPIDEIKRLHWFDSRYTLRSLLLLLLAVLLLAWYRYDSLRSSATAPADTVVSEAAPTTTATPQAEARRGTPTVATSSERRPTRATPSAPSAPSSSDAEPIAGNRMPDYPAVALRRGEGGKVLLRVSIDAQGQPTDIDFVQRSGSRELDRAALQAVRGWHFKPAVRNGKPISSVIEVPIDFKPQG